MKIICETKEEFKQAIKMARNNICDKIPGDECLRRKGCINCLGHNSIYIQMSKNNDECKQD